jgi:inner membrane transporter RhtA
MSRLSLTTTTAAERVPPQAWFAVSAIFHYLGPSFAVLLFPAVGVLGVAWLRIASAAVLFAPVTRPWRTIRQADLRTRVLLIGLGATLAAMNTTFYLALDALPMSLVAAIEFVGAIAVALWGLRTPRNLAALVIAVAGVALLIDVKWSSDTWSDDVWGLTWAALNGVLFVAYIALGHRIAQAGGGAGVERLGAAMAIALVFVFPVGIAEAWRAFGSMTLLLAGIGVGVCSSVIPYICDQLAMARLPRASFALMLSLLPAVATVMGALILAQIPSLRDSLGVALVMLGIAIHRAAPAG